MVYLYGEDFLLEETVPSTDHSLSNFSFSWIRMSLFTFPRLAYISLSFSVCLHMSGLMFFLYAGCAPIETVISVSGFTNLFHTLPLLFHIFLHNFFFRVGDGSGVQLRWSVFFLGSNYLLVIFFQEQGVFGVFLCGFLLKVAERCLVSPQCQHAGFHPETITWSFLLFSFTQLGMALKDFLTKLMLKRHSSIFLSSVMYVSSQYCWKQAPTCQPMKHRTLYNVTLILLHPSYSTLMMDSLFFIRAM